MNLIQTIIRRIITLLTLIILPSTHTNTLKNISKISILFILTQTIYLHVKRIQINKLIIIILTNNTQTNNTLINIKGLCIDNTSTPLLILTTILILTCILMREKNIYHTHKTLLICLFRTILTLFLTFTTSNIIFFYIMFERSIIPLIIIIGLWGSRKEKIRATYYFLLYTITGSIPLFLRILTLYTHTGTFNNITLTNTHTPLHIQLQLFIGLFLAFAIKTPLIPWHRWLPLAHVEAPGIGSVLLAGILLKLGTYGFIRFTIPILPDTRKFISPLIITIRIIRMWLARINRLRQNDIKRIIAYSSIAHMGIITAACFSTNPIRTKGAIILMISHGLTRAALFALVSFLYERHKSRLIKNFQGRRFTHQFYQDYY
uniref:NADH-ubiquinone oxidoreductase chain 4 n=1 Tax=Docosaccus maculatus TaxID=1503681 RepID=A0A0K0KN21_9METZ|nr:NADH dehydrogenase subunit 4 [Docosaccus maculatus]